jgi:hypothetical protein
LRRIFSGRSARNVPSNFTETYTNTAFHFAFSYPPDLRVEATALDYAHMQESVSRTVGQFDEAEALVRIVPLDGSSDGRAGGAVELWTARRRISEITGRRFVVVVVETAAAGLAKISLSLSLYCCSRRHPRTCELAGL